MPHPTSHPLETVISHEDTVLARCVLRRGIYIIGQEKRCEIVVNEPSISARHARLTVEGDDDFILEDLASANGTRVNGQLLTGPTSLTLDCEIQLGSTSLTFQRGGLPASVFQFFPADFLGAQRYAVGEALVHGSSSVIHETRELFLGRNVAMKILLPEMQSKADAVLRFIREAQVAAQLQHPSILPIYDLGLDEQLRLYSTTRFVDGDSLRGLLSSLTSEFENPDAPRPSLHHLLGIFQKICDAVAYAHSRGVIHCTLRPDIITVGRFGEVFVSNWGHARLFLVDGEDRYQIQAPDDHTEPALSRYSAPEQAEGALEDIDTRTDIHALGGLLFRLLTLLDPIRGQTDSELLEQALTPRETPAEALAGQPPCPHWPGGKLPEPLAGIAMKALNLSRDDRHQTVRELQLEVTAWQDGSALPTGSRWKGFGGLLGRG